MSYDFNALFQEYLDDSFTQRSGIPTLEGFVDSIYDEIEYYIENDMCPDPRSLYLYKHIIDNGIAPDLYSVYLNDIMVRQPVCA